MLTISSIGILVGLIALIMASELRWITLIGTVAAGGTSSDADATFRNETGEILSIIMVQEAHTISNVAPEENGTFELSKSPTQASRVDQDGTFRISASMKGVGVTATAVDGGHFWNRVTRYDDGEVTLEPQEALFVNTQSSSDIALFFEYNIGFRF